MNPDFIIVGGGPVGLFAGINLTKAGFNCLIIERRTQPISDSRSLGVHPISLQLFEELSILDPFLKNGLKITEGLAHDGIKEWGSVNFSTLDPPFNYILAIPQFKTERILEEEYLKLNPDGLIRGAEVAHFFQNKNHVEVTYTHNNTDLKVTGSYLIGCDGKNSFVRQLAGIIYSGKRYPDSYIMGDFTDTTNFAKKAVVYLTKQGMVECFPLPNGMRRWVIKTDDYLANPSQTILSHLIKQRIGILLHNVDCTMLSGFGVQHFLAENFINERIVLLGDAAHVVSPIGGQGMNLGWIGVKSFTESMKKIRINPNNINVLFNEFEENHRKAVRKAAFRAEINMKIGRKSNFYFLKKLLVKLMLSPVFKNFTTRMFTMHGLLNKSLE